MKEITKYQAKDGAVFNRKLCAITYENKIKEIESILNMIGRTTKDIFTIPYDKNKYRRIKNVERLKEFNDRVKEILWDICQLHCYDKPYANLDWYKSVYNNIENTSLNRFIDQCIPSEYETFRHLGYFVVCIDNEGREFTSFRAKCNYTDNFPDKSVWQEIDEWKEL